MDNKPQPEDIVQTIQNDVRFHAVMESMPLAIYVISEGEGQECEYMNQTFTDLFGYTMEDIPSVLDWWPKAYPEKEYREFIRQLWQERIEAAIPTKTAIEPIDAVVTCKDGTVKEIRWGFISHEKFNYAFGLDITEHKKDVHELLRLSKLLVESQQIAKLGGWEFDVDTEELFWTDETYRIHDTSPEEYNPTVESGVSYFLPESREIITTALDEAIINGKDYDLELETYTTKGRKINVRATCRTTQKNGKTQKLTGIFQDITERKLTEAILQESNIRFLASFVDAPIGMAICSPERIIVEVNEAFYEMLGYSSDELIGIHFNDITNPLDIKISVDNYEKLISGEVDKYQIEKRYRHKQGHDVCCLLNVSLVRDQDTTPLYFIVQVQDITKRKQSDDKLSFQASHDALTELINRHEFERRTERLLSSVKQDKAKHALCYMDLDQFKVVNDTCGHIAGDEMLRQLSKMLQKVVRHRDTLARLGGDEFGVLMEHCSLDDAHRVTTSLQTAIQGYQFIWEGRSFRVGVSMGLVPITDATLNLTELLKDADAACYMAKDKGRNRIHVHHEEDAELARRQGEMQWVTRIQHALDEDRFCLYAQAIESLDKRTDKHYELLIRMLDEQGEIIPPGAFLPAAERYNLITQLDRWVIEQTFRLFTENPAFLEQINFISINLSGQSFTENNMLDFIITQLDKTGVEAQKVCFEVTETMAIANLSQAMKFISTLKGLGCRFALDDFGSGLSSFAYLKNLPVDYLKIDGMFVKDIVDDPIDHAMVKSINEIGQVMGMQTIAEFVENVEIKGMLREIGVNYAQGYGIHKPQSFDELLNRSNNVADINKSKDDETKS